MEAIGSLDQQYSVELAPAYIVMRLSFDASDDLAGAAGIYVLYDDGKDVRLLITLIDQETSAENFCPRFSTGAENPNKAQGKLGILQNWDSVMIVDQSVKVIAIQPSNCQLNFLHPTPHLQCLYGSLSVVMSATTSSCILHLKRLC